MFSLRCLQESSTQLPKRVGEFGVVFLRLKVIFGHVRVVICAM